MIAYFDTSAFVPLLVDEPTSEACEEVWNASDAVVTSRLLYVETAAALAQAARMDRLAPADHQAALSLLDGYWLEFEVVEVAESLVRRAAELARECTLRGYDAVHCASAERLGDDDLVMVSADRALLRGCRQLGISTADVATPVAARRA